MARKQPARRFIETDAFRTTSYDHPFWVSSNRRSGRWNTAGVGCVQYLSFEAEGAWAEQLRHNNLRNEVEAAYYRATVWQVKVSEQLIADYETFEKAERAGFPPEALIEDDYERCRHEALRLEDLGYRGIVAPSAALPGSMSLTLFGPRVAIPWNTTVRTASALPAQALSTGSPPHGLCSNVRFFGQSHVLLKDYVARN